MWYGKQVVFFQYGTGGGLVPGDGIWEWLLVGRELGGIYYW